MSAFKDQMAERKKIHVARKGRQVARNVVDDHA